MNTSGRWDSALTIEAGNDVNLCLEGYTVSVEGSGSGYLMKVEEGASFNLYDEYFNQTEIVDEDQQGKIVNSGAYSGILNFGTFTLDGAVLKNFQSDISGAAVYSEGIFNMEEGLITADNDKMVTAVAIVGGGSEFNMSGGMISKATGMGVVVSSHPDNVRNDDTRATFNMTGGMIYGNTAGVLIDGEGRANGTYTEAETHPTDDVFTMTGGAISGNTLSTSHTTHKALCAKYSESSTRDVAPNQSQGAGVCNYGNFDMSGGLVANNYNYYYDFSYAHFYSGGGVANYGTYCLADQGTVASNYAGDGTGVYNAASFTMDGGTIRSNELGDRYSDGCGVYNSGTFTLRDGLIRDNVSGDQDNWYASDGGGIYNSNSGFLTMYGGMITRNRSSGNGAGVCNRGEMKLYGGSISSNACWYFGSNWSYKYGFEAAGVAGNVPIIGGNPVVQGNGYGYWFDSAPNSNEGDIFVDDTHQITIDPDHPLTDGAKIGVWSVRKPTADNPVYITNEDDSIIDTEFSRYFTSNDTNYQTKNDPKTNRVILGTPSCTVEYYLQNADKTGYTLSTDATDSSHATGSLTIDSLKKDFTGFTFEKAVLSGTNYTGGSLTANDEDIIEVYYTRNQYSVTLNSNDGTYAADYTAPNGYTYGTAVTLPTSDNISKSGCLFKGWYDNEAFNGSAVTEIPDTATGNKNYYAKWQPIDEWIGTALNVSVGVSVSQNAAADVSEESKTALQSTAVSFIKEILEGTEPAEFDADAVSAIRALANSGADKLNVVLTVGAQLTGEPSDAEKAALAGSMTSGENAQVWELTVSMSANAAMSDGTAVGTPISAFALNETHTPITFILTTGQDLGGKDVRVLYMHNGEIGAAESAVIDAANGIITVEADKFSPYVILSKTKHSSGGSGSAVTYPVKIEEKNPAGGTVSADKSSAAKGTNVTITVIPDKGCELGKLTVTDQDGKNISVTAKDSGEYTFIMPASTVTVTASFQPADWALSYRNCPKDGTCPIAPFADAAPADWYHDGVHFCLENKLMVGYSDDLFQPDTGTTRAMIAVMLWRLNGSPEVNYALEFEDVQPGTWYTEAIRWAVAEGIAQGYGNGSFGPDDAVTREQMVLILWQYAKYRNYDVSVGEDTNILSYTDAADVAQYAIPAMQWACGSGMVTGKTQGGGMMLDPRGSTTRTQVATMMMRFCAEIVK